MNDFNISSDPFNIVWMRRDLRLDENIALQAAQCQNLPIQIIFIFDTNILNGLEKDDARVMFIHQILERIDQQLKEKSSKLLVFYGEPFDIFSEIFRINSPNHLFFNEDFEPYGLQRDSKIKSLALAYGCECHTTIDHVIFHPSDILKSDKSPYTVFTPYSREWKKHFMERVATFSLENQRLLIPHDLVKAQGSSRFPSLKDLGFVPSQVTFPSSLPTIDIIKNYDKTRDFPSQNGTSKLGVHLRFGTISIRSLAEIAWNTNTTFLNELIWREFYIMILYHFPFVQDSSFKTDYRGISWLNQADDIEKWKSGKTGYPLVDAGMRELVNTGYMHNRVRMVTASFLTKHLLVDWRIGEAFFAKHLLDFELASNNGGWQWCAGTGTDAAPYFRIFNPTIQAKTFDPESKYIRKWVPEIDTFEYPKPIVEHTFARQRCLDVYKIGIQPKIKING